MVSGDGLLSFREMGGSVSERWVAKFQRYGWRRFREMGGSVSERMGG